MVETLKSGEIIRTISENGNRKTFFPKKSENKVSHVRPHARNADDTYDLPVRDKLTGISKFTKHCFWINASYVQNEIFEK